MKKVYDEMRAEIIASMGLVEALIDFGEDEGISDEAFQHGQSPSRCPVIPRRRLTHFLLTTAKAKVLVLRNAIDRQLDDGRRGEIIRAGIHLAIIGAPNAGKSSLLNTLGWLKSSIKQDSNS